MNYNSKYKDSYHYVDEYGMMLVPHPPDLGKGDSIKRTFLSWYCYRDKKLYDGILSNIHETADGVIVYRHPERLDHTMSRDHLTFLYIIMKMNGDDEYLKRIIKKMKWKISDKFNNSLDFWLWSRVMIGQKWAIIPYYLVMISMMTTIGLWNNLINLIAGYKWEQKQDDYVTGSNSTLTRWQFICKGLRCPSFTIYYHVWQIWALPKSIFKPILKFVSWLSVYRYNWVLKMLLGHPNKPKLNDVMNYKPMTSNRWTAILNETNTWDCHIIDEKRYNKEEIDKLLHCNVMDKDLLLKVYEERYK